MVGAMTAAAAVPHCHYFDDIGVDELMRIRQALQGSHHLDSQRLTLLPLLIKVSKPCTLRPSLATQPCSLRGSVHSLVDRKVFVKLLLKLHDAVLSLQMAASGA